MILFVQCVYSAWEPLFTIIHANARHRNTTQPSRHVSAYRAGPQPSGPSGQGNSSIVRPNCASKKYNHTGPTMPPTVEMMGFSALDGWLQHGEIVLKF